MDRRSSDLFVAATSLALFLSASMFSTPSSGEEQKAVLGKPISAKTLAEKRGGRELKTVVNLNDVRGTVENNSATNVVTGNNTISASFAGAAGVPMVIQNTGNNVLIQNATIVNVQLQP